jgi:5'-phosphate synthase pdxT subunit
LTAAGVPASPRTGHPAAAPASGAVPDAVPGAAPDAAPGADERPLDVGVLSVQGDFAAHERAVAALGHRTRRVKAPEHLDGLHALLLPGGESTTMLKRLREDGLWEPLGAFCRSGRPVFGTCAGAILLARRVLGPEQPSLGVLDVDVERNAYGRQRESFEAALDEPPCAAPDLVAVFIRAPVIRRVGPGVQVLARHGGHPVLVRSGPVWAASFHPEMAGDTRVLAAVLAGAGAT